MEEPENLLYGSIEKGKKYPISLGKDVNNEIFALQYGFKPVNLDTTKSGSLSILDNEATVEWPKIDDTLEVFKGKPDDNAENEYLLVFENSQFKVVKVNTLINNLKPIRSESRSSSSKVPRRKNVASEIKERAVNAKKRKLSGTVPVEPTAKPNTEESTIAVNHNEINSLDDLFS